jgi:nucleotide-binding universal stress UspA family protein
MRPILVATDGSDGAKRAVEAVARAAGKLDTDLWILHVMDGFSEDAARFAAVEKSLIGDALEAAATVILTAARSQAETGGAKAVHLKHCSGDCAKGSLRRPARSGRLRFLLAAAAAAGCRVCC